MTVIDWIALGVVLISCLAGVMRGFVREAVSLAGWVLAFLAARLLAPEFAPWLPGLENEALRHAAAIVLVFVLVLLVVSLAGRVLGGMVQWAGLGGYDRFLGFVFGGARAGLILVLFSLLAGLTALPKTDGWRDSISHGWLEAAAAWVIPWLPSELAALVEYQGTPRPDRPDSIGA